jgi:hypothetical protein
MCRWFPTAALLAALALPCLTGCGPSAPSTGKGGNPTNGPGSTGKPSDSGKDTAKPSSTRHHDPG